MAIIPNDSLAQGVVIDGILYYKGDGANAMRLQKANNNRAVGVSDKHPTNQMRPPPAKHQRGSRGRGTVTSAGVSGAPFTELDQRIVRLDRAYDLLPDKGPWITYAENIDGEWNLCANCMPDSGPKKLYRQYNFNRLQLGLDIVDAPIDDTAIVTVPSFSATWRITRPNNFKLIFTSAFSTDNSTVVARIGMALANPSIIYPIPVPASSFPGDPIYEWATGCYKYVLGEPPIFGVTRAAWFLCSYGPDGEPGPAGNAELYTFVD